MTELDEQMAKYEGDFLEAADLMRISGDHIEVEVSAVVGPGVEKDSRKKLIERPILSFTGKHKRLIIGKVNTRIMRAMFGTKASGWVGKKIKLCVRYGDWFGQKDVPTIRIVCDVPMPWGSRQHYGREQPEEQQCK